MVPFPFFAHSMSRTAHPRLYCKLIDQQPSPDSTLHSSLFIYIFVKIIKLSLASSPNAAGSAPISSRSPWATAPNEPLISIHTTNIFARHISSDCRALFADKLSPKSFKILINEWVNSRQSSALGICCGYEPLYVGYPDSVLHFMCKQSWRRRLLSQMDICSHIQKLYQA